MRHKKGRGRGKRPKEKQSEARREMEGREARRGREGRGAGGGREGREGRGGAQDLLLEASLLSRYRPSRPAEESFISFTDARGSSWEEQRKPRC